VVVALTTGDGGSGFGNEASTASHVLPVIPGIAYSVAQTRVEDAVSAVSTPPSDCCSVAR
jgi:hypothetical protein